MSRPSSGDEEFLSRYYTGMTIHARIRRLRQSRNLSQAELARRVGVTRGAVSQWEKKDGIEPSSKNIEKLAITFNAAVEWIQFGKGEDPFNPQVKQFVTEANDDSNAIIGDPVTFPAKKIPAYGTAQGGPDGEFVLNGNILSELICPPQLSNVSNAYAVYVAGDSMEPRYTDGEVVYVNPKRTPRRGDYVVAQIPRDDDPNPLAFIKRLVKWTTEELVLEQFNPEKELKFPGKGAIVHVIVMSGVEDL